MSEIFKALSKAQSEIKPIIKNSENPHFRSSYADLAAVTEAVMPVLTKHGFSVVQTMEPLLPECGWVLKTRLIYQDGEKIEGLWPVASPDNSPQKLGSAATYARRYSLMAIVCAAAADDDDGEAAEGRPHFQPKTQPRPNVSESKPKAKLPLSPLDELKHLTVVKGIKNQVVSDMIKSRYKKALSTELTEDEIKDLIEFIRGEYG